MGGGTGNSEQKILRINEYEAPENSFGFLDYEIEDGKDYLSGGGGLMACIKSIKERHLPGLASIEFDDNISKKNQIELKALLGIN